MSRKETEGPPDPERARFPLGRLVATPGALNALVEAGQSPLELLIRHQQGDWGELDEEDLADNRGGSERHNSASSRGILRS